MKRSGMVWILLLFIVSAGFFVACGGGGGNTELITNGGFETGDLTGWTLDTFNANSDIHVLDTTALPNPPPEPVPGVTSFPLGMIEVTLAGPSEGTWYAVTNQSGPSATALIQSFTVPEGDDSVVLTFDMFVLDASTGIGPVDAGGLDSTLGTNQHARVDILSATAESFDTGLGVVRNLYLNVDGYEPVVPYISYSFDISEDLTAGETYQLRFAEVDNRGPLHVGVDNVSIKSK